MERIEIVGSRVKTALYLAFSVAAVCLALWLFKDDKDDAKLELAAAFFAICALAFVWLLIRPQRLVLESDGFSLAGGTLRKSHKVAWKDVGGFLVVPVRYRTTMVGYIFSPEAASNRRGLALARRISGVDGALHGLWPISNAQLVDELNAYRTRAIAKAIS